ncbi:MAG: Signal transduction histidine kinase [Labilithrix sp.]|nr:Signal transduction histidine kinase [Labilithrix sp.]
MNRPTSEPAPGAHGPFASVSRVIARSWLQLSMLAAIGAVFAAAAWSATVERRAALADFSHEHAALATMVAVDFVHRLGENGDRELADEDVLALLHGAQRLEVGGELMVLVARPRQEGFLTTDHRLIPSARLRAALDAGDTTVIIPRDEAVEFGLPHRRAVAGLSRAGTSARAAWGIVVLASAERMRDREDHEAWRLGLTVLVVTALVTLFGGLAQRRQRRELELQRQVAVSALERDREALLAKADKMAALAALSTGIAHELGTPLGVIVGRVEQALARKDNDERVVSALGIVLEQVSRIQAIVRGCLALARGDAPHLVQTSPASITKHAVELVRHRFSSSDVALTWDVDADLPGIACEPSLFEQALVNVLLNACQATPAGSAVRLHVSSAAERVLFVVDDEGAGIPDDVAQRATEPFFSTKREEGGSGLGLTIAREIVSHHAGTLTLAKREGARGTRATITVST